MRTLILAVAGLLALPAAALGGDVALAWKLEKGTVLRYRHRSEQEAVQGLAGGAGREPVRTKQAEAIEYRLTVLDTEPSASAARVLCRYDEVAIDLEQMMLGRVSWDSHRREDLARADEPAVRPYARLIGQEFSFLLTPRGEVADVRGYDRVRATVLGGLEDSPFAKLALGNAFADEAIRSELERGFAVLPPGPVAPGATWTRTFEQPLALLGTLRYAAPYRLERVEDGKAYLAFTIALERGAAAPPAGDPIAARTEVDFKGGKGAGTAVFDVAAGRLLRSEATLEMKLSTRLLPPIAPKEGPGSASATSEVKQKVTIELVAD